jgi:hypothetical protein
MEVGLFWSIRQETTIKNLSITEQKEITALPFFPYSSKNN